MRAVRAFLRGSGFYLCALLAMIGLTSVIYLRPGAATEAFAPAGGIAARLPVIVYGEISADSRLWGALCISPAEFESDMAYLRANGYTAMDLPALIGCALEGAPLPERPVVIAFDDGCLAGYFEALPILRKYGVKAVCTRADLDTLLPGRKRMPPVKWVARPHGEALDSIFSAAGRADRTQ